MPIYKSTRTVAGAQLQTNRQLGLKHNVDDYTTINQAVSDATIMNNLPSPITAGMEVLPDYNYETDSDNLYTRYLVLGNGGITYGTDAKTGLPYTTDKVHRATDTALYSFLPLVARLTTADLTASQRANYGIRRTLSINGTLYAFYFGYIMDTSNVTATTKVVSVNNGVTSTSDYVPTINNLKPTAPTEDVTYNGDYITVGGEVEVTFTVDQIQDIVTACRLLYGRSDLAIMSEIGVCSGVLKAVSQRYPDSGAQSPISIATNTYYEIVACQVGMFSSSEVNFSKLDQDFTFSVDLAIDEPLYGS